MLRFSTIGNCRCPKFNGLRGASAGTLFEEQDGVMREKQYDQMPENVFDDLLFLVSIATKTYDNQIDTYIFKSLSLVSDN